MYEHLKQDRIGRLRIIISSALLLLWGCSAQQEPAPAQDSAAAPPEAAASEQRADTPSGEEPGQFEASSRIFIDSEGNRISPPAGWTPPRLPPGTRSSEGLRVESSPVEGGGQLIRLGDRFRVNSVATIDEEGRTSVETKKTTETDSTSPGPPADDQN